MFHPRRHLGWAASLVFLACGADEYAPCSGEDSVCSEATQTHDGAFDGCLCTIYCESDDDCPTPESGNATPRCKSFGDYEINGESAACSLECDGHHVCPDGMSCNAGECWGRVD